MKESIREAIGRHQPAAVRRVVRGGRAWARSRSDAPRMLPSFLLLGGQRCGTTSLYRYLCEHPDVHPALVKEIQYFTVNYRKGEGWYRSQFPLEAGGGHTFDASPYYLFHPMAPERAATLVPDAKLVVLLRNPVDRAFSHYQHNVGLGVEDLSFEEALAAEEGRMAGEEERLRREPDYQSSAHRRYSYIARGRYELQLARWLAHFDASRLKVIVSEEFFDDPGVTFGQVLQHLGLSPLQLARYERFTRRGAWDGPPLSGAARRTLQDAFEEPNRRLEAVLARHLPW